MSIVVVVVGIVQPVCWLDDCVILLQLDAVSISTCRSLSFYAVLRIMLLAMRVMCRDGVDDPLEDHALVTQQLDQVGSYISILLWLKALVLAEP